MVEVFSGLVAFDTELQLVPDLAERWTISADGTVYTFTLRENARFHDGKSVTAHDVKWSIERALHPETASPVAGAYLDDIVGVEAVLAGHTTDVSGLRVIDYRTVQFTIDAPKAYFLAKLTFPTGYVLDRENVEAGGDAWTDAPNGTGPFRLKEYRHGERIVLERNPDYVRDVGGNVERVVLFLDDDDPVVRYENDELDLIDKQSDLERVLDPNHPLNRELVRAPPGFTILYVGFNTTMPPFDDVKFRQALNHAVDKERIADEKPLRLKPTDGILPPGFPGFNPGLQGLRFDPDRARQLLAESRYATTRPEIVLAEPVGSTRADPQHAAVLEMWKRELGVEVELRQVEWAEFLENLYGQKYQAFGGGWIPDYPDPQNFLDVLLHTDSDLNFGNYSHPAADALLEQARAAQDHQQRIALYRQAEALIVQDAAWVPLWSAGETHVLMKPHVRGYSLTPGIVPKLRQVRIER